MELVRTACWPPVLHRLPHFLVVSGLIRVRSLIVFLIFYLVRLWLPSVERNRRSDELLPDDLSTI